MPPRPYGEECFRGSTKPLIQGVSKPRTGIRADLDGTLFGLDRLGQVFLSCSMAWNDPAPLPKQGVWEHWTYGKDIQGWSLRCGPMFYGDVRKVGEIGPYYAQLNSDLLGSDDNPKVLQRRIEEEIVRRVRQMTGPYKLILARVKRAITEP